MTQYTSKFKLLLSFFVFLSILSIKIASGSDQQLHKVIFDHINHPKEQKIVYQYLLEENQKYNISDDNLQKEQIGIDLYDINGDGNKEILAYLSNSAYCGSHGCSFSIFKVNDSNKLVPFYWNEDLTNDSLIVYKDISLLKNKNMNFHDILFDGYDRIWRWQGNHYNIVEN